MAKRQASGKIMRQPGQLMEAMASGASVLLLQQAMEEAAKLGAGLRERYQLTQTTNDLISLPVKETLRDSLSTIVSWRDRVLDIWFGLLHDEDSRVQANMVRLWLEVVGLLASHAPSSIILSLQADKIDIHPAIVAVLDRLGVELSKPPEGAEAPWLPLPEPSEEESNE